MPGPHSCGPSWPGSGEKFGLRQLTIWRIALLFVFVPLFVPDALGFPEAVPPLEAALAAFRQERYHDALEHYRQAFAEAQQAGGSAELKGRILRGIGVCWALLSDYQAALDQLLLARSYTIQGGNAEDLAALDANIASVYLDQGEQKDAERLYRRALGWLEQSPRSPHRAAILANLAVVELGQKRYHSAMASLERALRAAQDGPADRIREAALYDLLGFASLGLRTYPQARRWFERGLEARRSLGPASNLARSFMLLGRTELERGDARAALRKLDESIVQAEQRDSQTDLWQALYWRGRSYWDAGRREDGVRDYQRSVAVLESLRPRLLPADNVRVAYEVTRHEVYAALAEALGDLDRPPEAFHAVELGRAQSLRALVESRHHAGLVPAAVDFGKLQERLLGPDTLLLNFYAGRKSAYLWAVTDSAVRFYHLPQPSGWIGDIPRFVRATEASAPEARWLGLRLYRTLLGQVEPSLLGRRHWIIAADGDLVLLPFCALPVGQKRYLVEEHSFTYTPSASVLYSLQDLAGGTYDYDFLGLADPIVNPADTRWGKPPEIKLPLTERLPRLVSSESEVRACASLFGDGRATLLTGFDVSKNQLRQTAQQAYRYWHFTSHVVASPDRPEASFIALSMPRSPASQHRVATAGESSQHTAATVTEPPQHRAAAVSEPPQHRAAAVRKRSPEKLRILDILDLPVRAEMVMLNGCDSGSGKNLPGAGVLGLARAFLAAGSRSVCATRWKIPDERGALVRGLYRRLADGSLDCAEALRQAQLEMIGTGDWRSEPRYWAAYFLLGSCHSEARATTARAGQWKMKP